MGSRLFQVGDWVRVKSAGYHNLSHTSYNTSDKKFVKGEVCQIEAVDYTNDYLKSYTVIICGVSYGVIGLELIENPELEQIRNFIYDKET